MADVNIERRSLKCTVHLRDLLSAVYVALPSLLGNAYFSTFHIKGRPSPYSITERRVPELIPVLGSQPAGDASHTPGGRLPLLSRKACSYPRNP